VGFWSLEYELLAPRFSGPGCISLHLSSRVESGRFFSCSFFFYLCICLLTFAFFLSASGWILAFLTTYLLCILSYSADEHRLSLILTPFFWCNFYTHTYLISLFVFLHSCVFTLKGPFFFSFLFVFLRLLDEKKKSGFGKDVT